MELNAKRTIVIITIILVIIFGFIVYRIDNQQNVSSPTPISLVCKTPSSSSLCITPTPTLTSTVTATPTPTEIATPPPATKIVKKKRAVKATPTASVTATATAATTSSPSSTPTSTPTSTPSPTPSPTPTTYTLQPDGTVGKDTKLEGFNQTSNYGSGVSISLENDGSVVNSLIQFDLSAIANQTLTSATLTLYADGSVQAGNVIRVQRLSRTDWVETEATWLLYKTGSAWTTPGGDPAGTPAAVTSEPTEDINSSAPVDIDILTLAQDALNNRSNILNLFITLDTPDVMSFISSDFSDPTLRPLFVATY